VYWQRSTANGGPLLYNWGAEDWVKAYAFNGSTFAATPSSQGSGTQVYPGGILRSPPTAIPPAAACCGRRSTPAAVNTASLTMRLIRAFCMPFDANNVATELWNSTMNSARDNYGNFAKYVPPLVANGKVYVATFSDQVAVYGLLSSGSSPAATPTFSPVAGTYSVVRSQSRSRTRRRARSSITRPTARRRRRARPRTAPRSRSARARRSKRSR
jgi:hypothetical protein